LYGDDLICHVSLTPETMSSSLLLCLDNELTMCDVSSIDELLMIVGGVVSEGEEEGDRYEPDPMQNFTKCCCLQNC